MAGKTDRRSFVQLFSGAATGFFALPWLDKRFMDEIRRYSADELSTDPEEAARDERFWKSFQRAFRQSSDLLNLENGYFSPQPADNLELQADYIRMINERPSWYMRKQADSDKQRIKEELAQLAGCGVDEMVITRNTTESLNTVIAGIDFEKGDEAIMSRQDYGSMLEAFAQQARRRGLVNKFVELPLHPNSDSEIVEIYERAITDKTKVILVTHLINITGQVLPVRKICDMAHGRGVEVIVDGAHSFAHLDFKIPDLDCDYFGASLHKWLSCPLGTGILYIKKDKIPGVWPLFGDVHYAADDIRKFEHIGTHPVSSNLTISDAIAFHKLIGSARKEARLRYLKSYWTEQVKDFPGLRLNTPMEKERSSAIANVAIDGYSPVELADKLFNQYKIFTVAIDTPPVHGVRVTPHLFTQIDDLDRFVKVLGQLCVG